MNIDIDKDNFKISIKFVERNLANLSDHLDSEELSFFQKDIIRIYDAICKIKYNDDIFYLTFISQLNLLPTNKDDFSEEALELLNEEIIPELIYKYKISKYDGDVPWNLVDKDE